MRILDFLFQIVEKFSPMNDTDRAQLRNDANVDYVKVLGPLTNEIGEVLPADQLPPKMSLKQKIVIKSERWEIRLGLALAFIAIVPIINNWLNPQIDEMEDDDED